MLAEIFMVRLEAEARLVEVLPPSTPRFVPFSASSQFVKAPSEERPVRVVR